MREESVRQVDDLFYHSYFLPFENGQELHLQRIYCRTDGPVAFMVHGSVGNGRIFYSLNGKGLAPFLARQGYDTFIVDLRGRGRGNPPVDRHARYGQTEAICEDLPTCLRFIESLRENAPWHWVAHSWGGILLMSMLARFPHWRPRIQAGVFFGSKRTIRLDSWKKRFALGFAWGVYGRLLVRWHGYVHGKHLGFGDDAETAKFFRQTGAWLGGSDWIDSDDRFDYGTAIRAMEPLPVLHFTGFADRVLAEAGDVRRFIQECGGEGSELRILGKTTGARNNYGHNDILTHPDAVEDHFPDVLTWFREHDTRPTGRSSRVEETAEATVDGARQSLPHGSDL